MQFYHFLLPKLELCQLESNWWGTQLLCWKFCRKTCCRRIVQYMQAFHRLHFMRYLLEKNYVAEFLILWHSISIMLGWSDHISITCKKTSYTVEDTKKTGYDNEKYLIPLGPCSYNSSFAEVKRFRYVDSTNYFKRGWIDQLACSYNWYTPKSNTLFHSSTYNKSYIQ